MSSPPDNPDPPHSRNLRDGRRSEDYACYAITKNVEDRLPVLVDANVVEVVLESFQFMRAADQIRLIAFCVMPDHYHVLFFLLPGGGELSALMQRIGRHTAREINKLLRRGGPFWQEGFYDHRCRDEDEIIDRATYIEHNPVRKAFVENADQWAYSSAHPARVGMLDRDWYSEWR